MSFVITPIPTAIADMQSLPLVGLLLATLIVLGVTIWVMTRYRKWLRDLGDSAAKLAQGDLSTRVPTNGPPDIAALADTLNQMAEQLDGRLSEVAEQRHELDRLESIRQDFVANVSHELRTPISAVKAAAETLLDEHEHAPDGPIDTAAHVNFLKIILRQSDRLQSIVEDLLSLASIEQGNREGAIELTAAPLSPLIAAAVETVQAKADAKNISIRTRCETGLMAVMNRMLLEQALINLIDNAVKYSPEGTVVEVDAGSANDEVVIQVTDHGRGIEPAHLPRLFERFYRTDKARSRALGGTGLGLSIVKHIAEAHGGRVQVESRVGQGSRFTLVIQPGGGPR
ncbi:MAG: ATP-binding protein [Planctomycetota bacterium]